MCIPQQSTQPEAAAAEPPAHESRKAARQAQPPPASSAAKPLPTEMVCQFFKKTKPCRYWPKCSKGDACSWAHGNMELRSRFDFTKSKMCAGWKDGRCKLDPKVCRFAHGPHELRRGAESEWDGQNAGGDQWSVPAPPAKVPESLAEQRRVPTPPGLEPPVPVAAQKMQQWLRQQQAGPQPTLAALAARGEQPAYAPLPRLAEAELSPMLAQARAWEALAAPPERQSYACPPALGDGFLLPAAGERLWLETPTPSAEMSSPYAPVTVLKLQVMSF